MKSYMYIFLLIIQGRDAFCQQQKHAYDDVLRKLSRQSWWYVKSCENGTCNNIDDSTYFYLREGAGLLNKTLLERIKYHTNKDLVQVSPQVFCRLQNVGTGSFEYRAVLDRIPDFCFIDSNVTGHQLPIFTLGEDGFHLAEVDFTSETEFTMSRVEKTPNGNIERKLYFRSRGQKN